MKIIPVDPNIYWKATEDGKLRIVGNVGQSFYDDGIELLTLDGFVLGAYVFHNREKIDIKYFSFSDGLSQKEKIAARYFGEAYSMLYNFFIKEKNDKSLMDSEKGFLDYIAATLAMPLEDIRKINGELNANYLANIFCVPKNLAQRRLETLKFFDPDIYIRFREKYEESEELPEDDYENDVVEEVEEGLELLILDNGFNT